MLTLWLINAYHWRVNHSFKYLLLYLLLNILFFFRYWLEARRQACHRDLILLLFRCIKMLMRVNYWESRFYWGETCLGFDAFLHPNWTCVQKLASPDVCRDLSWKWCFRHLIDFISISDHCLQTYSMEACNIRFSTFWR